MQAFTKAIACLTKVLLLAVVVLAAEQAHAGCNLIPGTTLTFNGALGATNRPFAAPGEPFELHVRPCDTASDGLSADATDHLVSIFFKPVTGARRDLVVVTADPDCSAVNPLLGSCAGQLGGGTATCVSAVPAGTAAALTVVEHEGVRHLRVVFPNSDAEFAPDGDDRTLSGPAAIVVTRSSDPLPCAVATSDCASQSGLLACIDRFFANDGACGRAIPEATFPHFTALPPPNDYQADCFADSLPCTALAAEVRVAADPDGNILMPVDWRGVLVQSMSPVPRLLQSVTGGPVPLNVPHRNFVGSYTPEGGRLPPIFEPQVDLDNPDPDRLKLFGSTDAPYTVLRLARRHGTCASGPLGGDRCSTSADCAGRACVQSCLGDPGIFCTDDAECGANGPCAANFANLSSVQGSGPLILPRAPSGTSFCQAEPQPACTMSSQCPAFGDACVSYAYQAEMPVPLEGFLASEEVHTFALDEAIDLSDFNGDGDMTDSVMTLRDRLTGRALFIGAGGTLGRAIINLSDGPFRYPAVAIEGDVVALLESEATQGTDANSDGDSIDTILRIYRRDPGPSVTDVTPGDIAADAAPIISGRSLAVSNGLVFFRAPEAASALAPMTRASVTSAEEEADSDSYAAVISADGRYVAFASDASNLTENPNSPDAYVRDRLTGTTERADLGTGGLEPDSNVDPPIAISPNGRYLAFYSQGTNLDVAEIGGVFVRDRQADTTERVSVTHNGIPMDPQENYGLAVSDDGRFVAFATYDDTLVADDANFALDIFVRDRCVANGELVGGCTPSTERVSVDSNELEGSDDSCSGNYDPIDALNNTSASCVAMSADGRFVAFTSGSELAPDDTNFTDVYVRDRLAGTTERVNLTSTGEESDNDAYEGVVSMSSDGRYVAFASDAENLVPIDENLSTDVFVRDRLTGTTTRVSVSTTGAEQTDGGGCFAPAISANGRFVTFTCDGTELSPGDIENNADVYLRDRLAGSTQRVSRTAFGNESQEDSWGASVASSGAVAFLSPAEDFVLPDEEGALDVFVLGASAMAGDLSGDGDALDTILETMDPLMGPPGVRKLCPADDVAVAAGRAVFLRPEDAGVTSGATCPAGTLVGGLPDLNGDTDTGDSVVHFWPGSGNVQNLHCAGTAVGLSADYMAALISESDQNKSILNGDGDADDDVVAVRAVDAPAPSSCFDWTVLPLAAESLAVSGSVVAFLVPEAAHGDTNLNPGGLPSDADATDRVLHVHDAAGGDPAVNVAQAAEEFVLGDRVSTGCGDRQIIAFRTSESAQGGQDLNGDGDASDDVLQVYDAVTGELHNVGYAVTPCPLEACDPRLPYRVIGSKVKFLTFECDQGGSAPSPLCLPALQGSDLNGNGVSGRARAAGLRRLHPRRHAGRGGAAREQGQPAGRSEQQHGADHRLGTLRVGLRHDARPGDLPDGRRLPVRRALRRTAGHHRDRHDHGHR
jgi:Tol biopolymer transport system component